jgi:hypothetical protein
MKKLLLVLSIALLLAVSHTAGAASTELKLNDTLELVSRQLSKVG